jgi:hypothetical protein
MSEPHLCKGGSGIVGNVSAVAVADECGFFFAMAARAGLARDADFHPDRLRVKVQVTSTA